MFAEWIVLVQLPMLVCAAQYLMRTSPGGDGIKPAGIWAGQIEVDDNGASDDLYSHGFSSLDGVNSSMTGLQVTSLSQDPMGSSMLLVTEGTKGLPSLAIGAVCGGRKPTVLLHHVRVADTAHPYLADQECGYKCGWGPVSLYNGKVYFVLTAVFGRIYTQLKREMHIRMLDTEGCADIIAQLGPRADDSVKNFPVLQCSTLVSTLFSEDYKKPNPRPSRWSSQHLAMGAHKGKLHFYIQLIDTSSGSPHLSMVHVSEGDTSMSTLTSSPLDSVYSGSLMVRGLGSVDYSQGVLCWTAGDTLRCSSHVPGGDVQPVTVLLSGEALSKGVCTGNIPDESLRRSVTGLAIAETKNRLAVYFGCYAELAGTGGVGLVTVSKHGLEKAVYPVTSAGRRVFGSHVIVMRSMCPVGTDAPFTTATPPTSTPGKVRSTQRPLTVPCTCSSSGVSDASANAASHTQTTFISGFLLIMLICLGLL